MTDDSARITQLTTDAIRTTGEKMVTEIKRLVEQVDIMAEDIHQLARQYEADIGERTLELTDHITAYTALGTKTAEMFKVMAESMQSLKVNGGNPMVEPHSELPREKTLPEPVDLDDLKKLATLRTVKGSN